MRKDNRLEEGAYDYVDSEYASFESDDCASLRSIALSLKRIADSVDMGDTDEHMCIPKSLGAIAHALAGDKI